MILVGAVLFVFSSPAQNSIIWRLFIHVSSVMLLKRYIRFEVPVS